MSRHPDEPTKALVPAICRPIALVAATVLRVPAEDSLLTQLAARPQLPANSSLAWIAYAVSPWWPALHCTASCRWT